MKTHFKLSAFEKVKRIRLIVTVVGLLCALQGVARDREQVWPSGKMPDAQEHQIAAMTDETSDSKFKPENIALPISNGSKSPIRLLQTVVA